MYSNHCNSMYQFVIKCFVKMLKKKEKKKKEEKKREVNGETNELGSPLKDVIFFASYHRGPAIF